MIKPTHLSVGLIAIGIVLRVRQYLFNRSLWLDEAYLALNLTQRSFRDLTLPLDNAQGAPLGFLYIEKLLILGFGDSEYVMRFVPLLCGIASLFLFYWLATRFLDQEVVPVAIGLFVVSSTLVYLSSETKPYSGDVTIALLIYILAIALNQRGLTWGNSLGFGLAGMAAIWLSFPAVFVLAAASLTLVYLSWRDKKTAQIPKLLASGGLWLASFVISYYVSLKPLTENPKLLNFWHDSFMPSPFGSLEDLLWLPNTFLVLFQDPGGIATSHITVISYYLGALFLLGLGVMAVSKKRNLLLLFTPFLFALFASALKKYPFQDRLVTFLVPGMILIISEGISLIKKKTWRISPVISYLVIAAAFFYPASRSLYRYVSPDNQEDVKAVLAYIQENWQTGDKLYVYSSAVPAFTYYADRYGFTDSRDYILGNWGNGDEALVTLRGNDRVFVLFSHVGWDEIDEFRLKLHPMGTEVEVFDKDRAATFLYDFGE